MKCNVLFLVLFLCLSTVKVFFVLMNKVCKNEKKKKSTGRRSVVVCLYSRINIDCSFIFSLLIVSAVDKFSK